MHPNQQKMQSALLGFTEASTSLLEGAKKAIDSILRVVHVRNAELMALHAKSSFSKENSLFTTEATAAHLSHATNKLVNINNAIERASHHLSLLITSSNAKLQSAQNINETLKACINLNNQMYLELHKLSQLTGDSKNLGLSQAAAKSLTDNIQALINQNQQVRDEYLSNRGLNANSDSKKDAPLPEAHNNSRNKLSQ